MPTHISQETLNIAVLEQRVDSFENNFVLFKEEIKKDLRTLNNSSTEILLKMNTMETRQKVYAAVFGAIAGFAGSHLPSLLKGALIFFFPGMI